MSLKPSIFDILWKKIPHDEKTQKGDEETERALFEKEAEGIRLKGMSVCDLKCIRERRFLELRSQVHPKFKTDFKPRLEKDGGRLLDLGCCFGTEFRYFLAECGLKLENGVAVDIEPKFIELGFQLYQRLDNGVGGEGLRSRFIVADVLTTDGSFQGISRCLPFFLPCSTSSSPPPPPPPLPLPLPLPSLSLRLEKTTALLPTNPSSLPRGFEVVWAGSVFHLFTQDQVHLSLKNIFEVLVPGGILAGQAVGAPEPVEAHRDSSPTQLTLPDGTTKKNEASLRFLHSPSSLFQELKSVGFEEITIFSSWKEGQAPEGSKWGLYVFSAQKAGKLGD